MTKSKAAPAADKITVLRKSKCPNASGRAELEYAIGQDKSKTLYVSITSSTGGGFFSSEWIAIPKIKLELGKTDTFTSVSLQPLFRGKSVNTPAFLMAALLSEGFVERLEGKQREYRLTGKNPSEKKPAVKKASAKKKANRRA